MTTPRPGAGPGFLVTNSSFQAITAGARTLATWDTTAFDTEGTFNLGTEREWYTASNLVVHNCQCDAVPIIVWADEASRSRAPAVVT